MTQAREALAMNDAPCPNTNIIISFHQICKPKPCGRGINVKNFYPHFQKWSWVGRET